ncbi:MAG: hypothetical protein M1480_02120 [Bacteroidetes bacterium]|nr:hypothetical protein [Bacteroidota bacterium]
MNDKQSTWYHMTLAVLAYLTSIAALIVKPAIILATKTRIEQKLKEIEELQSGKGTIKSGKTTTKNSLRAKLEEITYNFASSLHSYATANSITDLAENTDTTESGFSGMREDNLYNAALEINKLADENKAVLDDYDITPEEITEHKALAEEYKDSIGDAGSSRKLSTEETAKLEKLYTELLALWEEEDKHINTLKLKKPELASGYFVARKLVNTGVRHDSKDENPPAANSTTPQQ